MFLKVPHILQETAVFESVFNEAGGLRPAFILNRDSNTLLSCKICEICKNTYFEGHLRVKELELMDKRVVKAMLSKFVFIFKFSML